MKKLRSIQKQCNSENIKPPWKCVESETEDTDETNSTTSSSSLNMNKISQEIRIRLNSVEIPLLESLFTPVKVHFEKDYDT